MSEGAPVAARILIIEDNETNLDLMVYLLKSQGYAPMVARDGGEGQQRLSEAMPDLIISDLQMPGVDGFEVVRQLKNDPQRKQIPVVAVTASAMVGDREKILAAHFDGYIAKPVNPETFVSQVEAFLPVHLRSTRVPRVSSPSEEPARQVATRGRILVVDDSPVNISLLRSTFEPMGYEIVSTNDPTKVCEMARQVPVDLILSDVHMQQKNGFELCQEVKADAVLQKIPFVLLSSTWRKEQDAAQKYGADKFILRPIEPQELIAEVESVIQQFAKPFVGKDRITTE